MVWAKVLASPAPFLHCGHLEAIVLIRRDDASSDVHDQIVTCRVCDLIAVMVAE